MGLISANSKTPALYVLAGSGNVAMSNLAAAQTATGVTFSCLEVFNTNVPTWADWEAPWFANDPSQGYTAWVAADPSNRQLIVSYNLISQAGGSMADPLTWETNGAAGAFNGHATALATNLVANGLGSSIIRLGLECNGNWNIDSIGGTAPGGGTLAMRTAWAQTFAQEVAAMRAVPGANFLFCWCPNAVVAGVPFADYYPGDSYVDIIGIDAYDAFANGTQPAPSAATTTALFGQAFGLTDITNFAKSHSKPLGLGEWGTQLGGTSGGIGDDPYYVQGIAAWVAANQVAFHCYFDSATDSIIPLSSSFPQTLAAYSAAFATTPGAPTVITSAASGVASTVAVLNGTVNPRTAATTYQFEWGTTTAYGTAVPASPGSAGSGSAAVGESYSLAGLTASATYHYRLNATNSFGTTHGADQPFTTTSGGGGGVPMTVSAAIDNFNDGGALKVFAVTGAAEAGGASAQLQAFDPGGDTVSVTPAGSGSLILFGVFERNTVALTAASGNTVTDTGAIGTAYTYAEGRYTGTVTAGSPVTAGCSTSVSDWNDIVAYELQASGTPAVDASTPAPVTGLASPLVTASFTPPGGAVLAAVVMSSCQGTAASNITITDNSGLGLTWTRRAIVTQTGSYAGVAAIFTATVPGAASPSGAPSTGITVTPSAAGGPPLSGSPSTGITIGHSATGTPRIAVARTTGITVTPSAAGTRGGAGAPSTGITVTPSATGLSGTPAGPPVFPARNLGVKAELLLNGTWTDITQYVAARNPVQITNMGRPDWTSTLQAAQLTLTLDNRTGRFSPKNSGGAYYPFITRNVQLRLSVSSQSVTGAQYSGYRFFGEVVAWPPKWGPSERDIYCDITAAGIWQRMSQLVTTLGSAYRRYYAGQAGGAAPRAYWPMEDGTGATGLVPYASAAGTAPATWAFVSTGSGLSLAASSDFKGSDAVPQLNAAAVTFTVPAGGTAANNITRFLLSVPAAGDSAAGTTNWNLAEVDSAGIVAKFEVYLAANGTLIMNLRNSGGTVIAAGTTTTNVKGQPYLVSCELAPSGGNVLFALSLIKPGAATVTETVSGTLTSATVGQVSKVVVNRAMVLMDTAIGHLAVFYGTPPSLVASAYPLNGYLGEKAMDRFTRLCAEMGIASETIGAASATAAMGPQVDDTLTALMQSVEDTDCGLLFESRSQFGLGYRSNASMGDQAAAAVFPYTDKLLDPALAPVFDAQLTRNNITVTNWTGYTQGAILTAGPMSVLNPPAGVGNGYNYQRAVCAAADSQLPGIANFLLNMGTVDEIRLPVVTLKMVRPANAAYFDKVPALRPGDYFQITNMPPYGGPSTARQLVQGYTETLTPKGWTFEFNSVPETPWETGFTPGTVQLAQLPGGSVTNSAAPGAGGSVIPDGSITPSMLSAGITIRTLGGNAVTISSAAPPTPNTGDMWIASATGLMSQWNGTTWMPVMFDGTATIQAGTITSALIRAGTIVAGNIAAGTITAALLASGIVVAGIIDATTVNAAQYIATGTQGEFLAYSGTPAAGNLAVSLSGRAGTDLFGNPYARGAEIHTGGLVLDNQGSAPSLVTGAATLYSSAAGRLRYLASTGENQVVERGQVNVSAFTVGNTSTPTVCSGNLSYFGTAASNQSSTFEIEINGAFHTSSVTPGQTLFQLFSDGSSLGNTITIGGAALNTNVFYAYSIRFRLSVLASGAPGTATIVVDGTICQQSVPVGSTANTDHTLGTTNASVSFDTTVNHTLQVRGWFSGSNAAQEIDTYITRTTNYN